MVASAAFSISVPASLLVLSSSPARHLDLAMSLSPGIGSKTKKILSPSTESPLREQGAVGGLESEMKQMRFGSKEDDFFDSQGWLDSDSEDDFVSVNGDLTPYRLSSPNYQIAANSTPQRNKELSSQASPEITSDPSSADAKRKLATVLQEEDAAVDDKQNASGGSEISGKPESYEVNEPLVPQLNHQTSFITGNEHPIEDLKQQKDKKIKTNKCCLPSLVCSLRFKERRKQKMNIVH